jgi:hypothetical protein
MGLSEPATRNGFHADHIKLLSDSLEHWSGHGLMIDEPDPLKASRSLYLAPFALLSHGAEADPVINYANHTAQQLFEMNWDAFTTLPSRLSAEAPVQAEREALLRRVAECGYIDDYCGVRISSSGKRFLIEQATVWNLLDGRGEYCGQAAMFAVWQPLASGIDSAAESNHD